MPSQPAPGSPKQYALQWVHIDDFTPGCYSAGHISTETPRDSQPLGSAFLPATYCCAALPGGALAPLPAIVDQPPFSSNLGGIQGGPYAVITGFALTPQLNDGSYELVTIWEADNGTNHWVTASSYEPGVENTAITGTLGPTSMYPSTGGGIFGSPYPCYTRMGSSFPPQPFLVFPTSVPTDPHGTAGHLWVYPHPSSPTSFTAQDLVTAGSQVTGQTLTYGNRVICLVGKTYSWPTGNGINTNENFCYTDPPESLSYGAQYTIAAIEEPWGYGAWGTVSVGELLVVKKWGGAMILNGDINVPSSIIRIPGVQSTGDFVGQAASTPIGLVYCSQNRGAWVWNGGNTAQKISQNLHDNFFDLQTNQILSNNYGFNVAHWQKWLMFSNNVMMDTELGGWWKLYPNRGTNPPAQLPGRDFFWYEQGLSGKDLICAPLKVFANTDAWYSRFDNTVPSPFYQWDSLPIHVSKDADRVLDVRQIVVRASDPTNTGNARVTVTTGLFSQTSTTAIGPLPTPIRFNVGTGAQGLSDINLTLYAVNSGAGASAPIIHSVDVGYIIRAGVSVTN